MNLEGLEEVFKKVRRHPLRTLACLVCLALFSILVMWLSGYLGERGRQSASTPEPSNASEDQYVRATKISPLGEGKYALVVEFGVRNEPTEGVHAGIDVTSEYTDVRQWFAPPARTDVPAMAGEVFKMSSTRREPPVYVRKFSDPSVTPRRSYYLYFEADKPLEVKSVLFRGFYE